jgi:zinc/manganese transport system substrate-binding protein
MNTSFQTLGARLGLRRQSASGAGAFVTKNARKQSIALFQSGVALRLPPQSKIASVAAMAFLGLVVSVSTVHAKLNVVATLPDIGAIAKEIGGDQINLTTMARPTEDPHFVDPKPSFIVKLNKADVLLHGGAELEVGWLPRLVEQARNAKIVGAAKGELRCCEGVKMREVPEKLDRSAGDIHAAGNPHFLVDPENAKIVAHHIAATFAELDAAHRAVYETNAARFMAALDAKLIEWQARLAPFQGRHFVAYHNSWPYFAARFQLKSELFLEPKPGIPPSPAHLATVMAKMKEQNVRVVIVDPYLNRKTAETVARGTGATVVDVTQFPGGVKGTEGGYIALMDYLVNSLATALDGAPSTGSAR